MSSADTDDELFESLDRYATTGDRDDDTALPLFNCLDRLAALRRSDGPSPAPTPRVGAPDRLGDYELGECLGRGGMGCVYRGRHVSMGHEVAIKIVAADAGTPQQLVDRFYQEARAAAGEEHPGVVAVRHVGRGPGCHYLVMDLVEGPSLAERLLDGPLPWRQAVELVARVADAVSHLHDRGVLHRDLKPSNILLDAAGNPHVTDFGLAKLTNAAAMTQSHSLVGTPRYMSPELASGRANEAGPPSDLFALGLVLFECLTGRPAFDAATPLEAVLQVVESDPPAVRKLRPDVPRSVQAIVQHCLEKEPADRYANAADLSNDLMGALSGEAVRAQRLNPAGSSRRIFRRRPAVLLHVVGIGWVAGLVQLAYWLSPGYTSPSEHYAVQGALLGWLVSAVLMHLLWFRGVFGSAIGSLWSAVDVLALTGVLMISDHPLTAPVVGYPVLIATAGVWLSRAAVWIATALSTLGYLTLCLSTELRQPEHYPAVFVGGLILVGMATGYHVQRVRWLTAAQLTTSRTPHSEDR